MRLTAVAPLAVVACCASVLGCGAPSGDASSDTRASSTSEQSVIRRVNAADALHLAPVLSVGDPPCADGATPAVDGTACYELGRTVIDGGDIAEATASQNGDDWIVEITLTTVGAEALDEIASACLGRSAVCPLGSAAVVTGGRVQSAPTFNAASFDGHMVIGGLSESEAEALAASLNGSDRRG